MGDTTPGLGMVGKTGEAHVQAEDRSNGALGIRKVQNPSEWSWPPGILQVPFFVIRKNHSINRPTEKKQSILTDPRMASVICQALLNSQPGWDKAHTGLADH